jgi:hypothetical protein
VDAVVPRTKLKQNLAMILKMHQPQVDISSDRLSNQSNGAAKAEVHLMTEPSLASDI